MKHTLTSLPIYAHFCSGIHKSARRPSTMTQWVSFAAGLRRIAGRRRPNFSRSRAARPRHSRRLHPGKRPPRRVPTRTSQDGARPSASKSAGLARTAPARNEKAGCIHEDVAALSNQDRGPGLIPLVSHWGAALVRRPQNGATLQVTRSADSHSLRDHMPRWAAPLPAVARSQDHFGDIHNRPRECNVRSCRNGVGGLRLCCGDIGGAVQPVGCRAHLCWCRHAGTRGR
jgi:hypothetical protein